MNKVLVTGVGGFVGFHYANRLIKEGYEVVGVDSLNEYYDVNLKFARLEQLGISKSTLIDSNYKPQKSNKFSFYKLDLSHHYEVQNFFNEQKFDLVVHLAAQAGVRYSIDNPMAYKESNIDGFLSIIEGCRHNKVKHLVFASSSSVYGLNSSYPFSEDEFVDHPMSLYAATKRANELMAHSYAHLYGLSCTGLRFFTAYGPWGRPDMALFIFTRKILNNEPIEVYNEGQMLRDFTYVDDIVEGIFRVMKNPPIENQTFDHENPVPSHSSAPYRVFNIGNNNPVVLIDFVREIEKALGKKANIVFKPLQAGDVVKTYATTEKLQNAVDYKPSTPLSAGVEAFVSWYRSYYQV